MGKFIDLTGNTIGNWTVLSRSTTDIRGKPAWTCRCNCGAVYVVRGSDLRQQKSKQCVKCRPKKHGHTSGYGDRSPEYNSWLSMKSRCMNPNQPDYHRYGGRGITICKRWQNSFEAFLQDLGPRPPGTCLERRDNDGNYSPHNCYWATRRQQAYNRCSNRNFSYNGETHCGSEWCKLLGLHEELVRGRLKLGWSFEDAITIPALPQRDGRPRNSSGQFIRSH